MKAITYAALGGPEVLTVTDRSVPDPGPGEVRVRVHISGVNPTDWKARRGSGYGELDEPKVPNQDGAGVIDAVGTGVDPSRVGQRVCGCGRPPGSGTTAPRRSMSGCRTGKQ